MAERVPFAPAGDDAAYPIRAAVTAEPGERAADAATKLYVEQEHLTRRKRFERLLKRAESQE